MSMANISRKKGKLISLNLNSEEHDMDAIMGNQYVYNTKQLVQSASYDHQGYKSPIVIKPKPHTYTKVKKNAATLLRNEAITLRMKGLFTSSP